MNSYPFKTLRDLLRYAVTRFQQERLFFGHGNNNAYDEAAYLLLHGLHLPLDTLEPFLDAILLPDEIMHLMTLINRRIKERIPAAYLTQEAWMHGLRFYVDQRVIVPRSLIGELLQEKLAPWLPEPDGIQQVLELCTGSGCLAIMAALVFPQAQIDAVDISDDALQVAQRNRQDYQLEERITLYQGDLYQALENAPAGDHQRTVYDLIITNPPYVNAQAMQNLPAEYLAEPAIALAGGADGMDLVRRIIAQAKTYLSPQGCLIVEIGNEYEHVIRAFPDLPFTWLPTSAGEEQVFLLHAQDL
jgi:ribosomal protein L3 glutamine methyltransferase